jgi:hypothetical protein
VKRSDPIDGDLPVSLRHGALAPPKASSGTIFLRSVGLGYASTFDTLALMTVVASIGVVVLVWHLKTVIAR